MAKVKYPQTASSRIFDDVLSLAGSLLRSRKDLGADKLRALAKATREYATALTDLPTLRAQAASASDTIEGLADYVLHTDIENMASDATTFARRHPLAAIGATIVAGIVASRLMTGVPAAPKAKPRSSAAGKKAKPLARGRRGANGSAQVHA